MADITPEIPTTPGLDPSAAAPAAMPAAAGGKVANPFDQFDNSPAGPANPFDAFDKPDPGGMSDLMHGIKAGGFDAPKMTAESGEYIGRALHSAGNATGMPSLAAIGDAIQQKTQAWSQSLAAGQAQDPGEQQSAYGQDGGFIRRNMYGLGKGIGQIGAAGVTGAVVGGTIGGVAGSFVGPEGTLAGAAGGAVTGALRSIALALPAVFGLSTAEETDESVTAAAKAAGASDEDAANKGLAYGAGAGVVAGAGAFLLNKIGLGSVAKPFVDSISGAAEGSIVSAVLNTTFKGAATSVAKAGVEGAAVNVAQQAAIEGINAAGGAGNGPTVAGSIDAAVQGGLIASVMHTGSEAVHSAKVSATVKLLADPNADPQQREQAAIGAATIIGTKDPALASDFALYADNQLAKGLPIEAGPDALYQGFAQSIRQQRLDDAAQQARTTQAQYPGFVPTGDEAAKTAPSWVTDPNAVDPNAVAPNGQPMRGPSGADPDMVTPNLSKPMPADLARTANPVPQPAPIPKSAPPALTELTPIFHAGSVDDAINATVQTVHESIGRSVADANQHGVVAGVITPAGSEVTPSAPDLAIDRQFYADQAAQAQADMRNQAIDANKPPLPPVPEDAFAQRQAQIEAEAAAQRDAAFQQANRDQLGQQADQATALSAANETLAAPEAGAKPATASTPMSQAMQMTMDRAASRMQNKPTRVTTAELGMLAQHHPDPAVRDQAAQLVDARANKATVFSPDQPSQPFSLDSVRDNGHFSFSPERGQEAAGAAAEPAQPVRTLEQTEPAVAPVKMALDQQAKAMGRDVSGASIEPVDLTSLPDARTPANNGVEGATTLSKSDVELAQKQVAVLGKKLVVFRQSGGETGQMDGMVSPDGKTIYLNADAAGAHHLVVVGHELAHTMRIDAPELFDALRKSVLKQAGKGALSDFYRYYMNERGMSEADVTKAMKDPATRDNMTEEFVADLVGNRFGEYRTWQQMFANAGKENRGLVYRIADYITKFIDKLLGNESFKKFATDDMVGNLQAVRQSIRKALSEYAVGEGSKAMEHEAGQLRAHQENLRAGIEPRKLVEPVEPRAFLGKEPSNAAPAAVPERDTPAIQGSRGLEAMEPPKKYGKAPTPTAEEGLTAAGELKAQQDAAAAATSQGREAPTPVTERKPIEQPQVVKVTKAQAAAESARQEAQAAAVTAKAAADARTAKKAAAAQRQADILASIKADREAQAQKDAEAAAARSARARVNIQKQSRVDTTRDSMMTAVAKLGGVNKAEARSLYGGDDQYYHGIKQAITPKGRSIDEMRQHMAELGYVDKDEHGKADIQDFDEKFNDGLRGNEHYTDDGYRTQAEQRLDDDNEVHEQDLRDAGYNALPEHAQDPVDEEIHDGPLTAEEEAAIAEQNRDTHGDVPFDEEPSSTSDHTDPFGDDAASRGVVPEDRAPDAARAEPGDGRATEAEQASTPEAGERSGEGSGQDFGLTGETPEQGEARLQDEDAARKARTRSALDEERRMQADEDAKTFRLTGSDREADADPDQDGFKFSRQRASNYLGEMDAAQTAAAKNIGAIAERKTVKQQMQEMKTDLGKKLTQGIADQFYPIKELSPEAYQATRLSKGYTGTVEATLLYGKPFLRDGVPDVDVNDKGYAHVLASLDGEHSRFFLWMAAHRASELKAQGKENLFTDQDISALKTLDQNDTLHPDRAKKFAAAQKEHMAFNEAVLDIARQKGLIDDELFDTLKNNIHVAFYRVMDDNEGMRGPGKGEALINQAAFKKLKGGTNKLNEDLLANTLANWSHLLGASMRNGAAQLTLDAAVKVGVADKVSYNDAGKGAVRVMRNGKAEFYEVNDPHLLTAISAMTAPIDGKFVKALSTFKRLLTTGTTLAPSFRINNLIRDTLSTLATTGISMNPAKNLMQGIKSQAHGSQTHASMLASGGIINFGTMLEGNEAKRTHQLIQMGVDKATILNNKGAVDAFWSKFKQGAAFYHEIGNKVENANRGALYEQLRAKGVNHADASFQARDIMDFSLQGSNNVVRFLTTAVPFLNARIQGAYKIGRAVGEQPMRAGMVMGSVAMASLALMLHNQDDPDWKARPDWDRDNYWWFKVGQTAYRVPKPFEVGAVGTLVERTWEKMFDPEMTNSRYVGELRDVLMSQFNLNPVPQMVKPLLNVYANRDDFTGNQIESTSQQSLQPEDRYTPYTSMTARFLGQLGMPDPSQLMLGRYSKLSPVQMDSLIRGYFGWSGVAATGMVDAAVRPFSSNGAKPAMTLRQKTLGIMDDLPANQSRYADTLYEQQTAIDQAYASWRAALKSGQFDKAKDIMEGSHVFGPSNRTLIQEHGLASKMSQAESRFALQEKRIADSPNLSGDTKRAMLNRIEQQRNNLAQTGSGSELAMNVRASQQ